MSALSSDLDGCATNLLWDEWFADELEPETRERLTQHLADCDACAERKAALAAQRARFLAQAASFAAYQAFIAHGPDTPAPSLALPEASEPRVSRRGRAAVFVGALAACFMLLSQRDLRSQRSAQELPSLPTKGAPRLGFFIKRGERVLRGESGGVVHPGERLRFTYASALPTYFALLNRDQRGATIYYPAGVAEALPLAAGRDIAFGFSIELDPVLGAESIYGLFCNSPVPLEPLRSELARTGKLVPPAGCSVDILRLEKRERE